MRKWSTALFAACAALLPVAVSATPGSTTPGLPPAPPGATISPYDVCMSQAKMGRDRCFASAPANGTSFFDIMMKDLACLALYVVESEMCSCLSPTSSSWCTDDCARDLARCDGDAARNAIECFLAGGTNCQEGYANALCECDVYFDWCGVTPPIDAFDNCGGQPPLPLPGGPPAGLPPGGIIPLRPLPPGAPPIPPEQIGPPGAPALAPTAPPPGVASTGPTTVFHPPIR